MGKYNPHTQTHKKKKRDYTREEIKPDHPKILKKNYHVTSQTAYHITRLALQENTTEGRVVDKIVRSYLAEHGSY